VGTDGTLTVYSSPISAASDANLKHQVPFDFLLDFARSFGKTGQALHSTDHRFAMICSGRDDRVEES
jgi:hypothetical protein